jgi:WhiB family redox-sensing transcriptional regulator
MAAVAALPPLIAGSLDWQLRAACRGAGTDLFFNPDSERGPSKRQREASAKAICAACPVVNQCLGWALRVREPHGVWGGMSTDERMELLENGRLSIAN